RGRHHAGRGCAGEDCCRGLAGADIQWFHLSGPATDCGCDCRPGAARPATRSGDRAMSEEPELLLYTTAGCHLCEQAEHILRTQLTGFRLTLVDVAESDTLVADYGIRIPVIALRGVDADL